MRKIEIDLQHVLPILPMNPFKVDQTALRCVPNTFLELLFQPQWAHSSLAGFRNVYERIQKSYGISCFLSEWSECKQNTIHSASICQVLVAPFPDRTENDTVFTFVFFVLGWWPVIISIWVRCEAGSITSPDVMMDK